MKIVSYIIILAISAAIGFSSINSLEVINNKAEIPKITMPESMKTLISFTRTT